MWAHYAFKTAFTPCALAHSFSGSSAGRFLEASWRRCHSSSGFSLSRFVLFLHVFPDRLMMIRSDLCVEHWLLSDSLCKQKSYWINGKNNVCKCKLLFSTDTLQQKIEITDLKPFFVGENTSGLRLLHSSVCMLFMYYIITIVILILIIY